MDHKAPAREFTLRGAQFASEPSVNVDYEEIDVGTHVPTLVAVALVLEWIVVEAILDVCTDQVVSGMRAAGKRMGLILAYAK